MFVRKAGGT